MHPCGLELAEGNAPSTDQGCVVRALRMGPLEQAQLSAGFARIGWRPPSEETRDGQTLRPDRANARRDAQGKGRSCLACCGRGVLGGTSLEPWAEEADAVTGHWTIAPIVVGVQGLFLLDAVLPSLH